MEKQIPYKKLTRKGNNISKAICDGCKKDLRVRNLVLFKGKFLCRNCRNQTESFKIQASALNIGRGYIKESEALDRTYEPKIYRSACVLHLTICLANKKFKLIVVGKNYS